MTHYLELIAIPHEELLTSDITSLMVQNIHQSLVHLDGRVGLGFPDYNAATMRIGGRVRCFGPSDELMQLKHQLDETQLPDYAVISEVKSIPVDIKNYYIFSRVQTKGQSDLRRAQKRLQKNGKSEDEIAHILAVKKQKIKPILLPHVRLKSSSTGQSFLLVIKKAKKDKPVKGVFNSYGLSQAATVPDF